MKLPVEDLRAGFQKRREEADNEGQSAKRPRRPAQDEPVQDLAALPVAALAEEQGALDIPEAIALVVRPGRGTLVEEQQYRDIPAVSEAGQEVAGEAGQAPAGPPVEVVDLEAEEEHPIPSPVRRAAHPRAVEVGAPGSAGSETGGVIPRTGLRDEGGPVDAGEAESTTRTLSRSLEVPVLEPRPAPRFRSMEDGREAELLLARLRRARYRNELSQESLGGVCDAAFVSMLQLTNEVFTLRDALIEFTNASSRFRDRANAFQAQRDGLAAELEAARAREAETADKLRAAEEKLEESAQRLADTEDRCESVEARARNAEERARSADTDAHKAAEKASDLSQKLYDAEERADAAEARARAAEEAATMAVSDAQAAEEKRAEAEDRSRAAEEKARRAIEEFQRSPEFLQELREMGVDAYEKGFEDCEKKIEQILGPDVLKNLQAGEPGSRAGPSKP